MSASPRRGFGTRLLALVGLAALAAAFLVPIRTCESCLGIGGIRLGDAVDLSCKGCGGDGRQTVFDIVRKQFRK